MEKGSYQGVPPLPIYSLCLRLFILQVIYIVLFALHKSFYKPGKTAQKQANLASFALFSGQ
jgi:hypothetical protein